MVDFRALEESLDCRHPSQLEAKNPVLQGLRHHRLSASAGAWALGQYSFLPKRIVRLLSAMRDRLRDWTNVYDTLVENINEERGSETAGIPHFQILKRTLLQDAGLDLSHIAPHSITTTFLESLERQISCGSNAFNFGMAFAMEASAHPELRIVCYIINEFWVTWGNCGELIRRDALESKERAVDILALKSPAEYTLEDFFVVHLQDFEVGHRDDLKTTMSKYIQSRKQADEVEAGFESVLDLMDVWWQALADNSTPATST